MLKFSLAAGEFTKSDGLREALKDALCDFEKKHGLPNDTETLPVRFAHALKNAAGATGRKVVVLVDEYGNPLLKNTGVNEAQGEENRALYKAFFAVLKDCDAYLRFVFFTGVTKFSKVSIFSDLNQLKDITLNKNFDAICGITQKELEENFAPEIELMAERWELSHKSCLEELKRLYDGYHFCGDGAGVYNPYSLINALDEKDFGSYWFETGTPTFLINKLTRSGCDIRDFEDGVKVSEDELKDYHPENTDPVPLFYQSGYLTIKSWNSRQRSCRLSFPNAEVKFGFLRSLAPIYLHIENKPAPFNIDLLDDAVEAGDTEEMRNWFTALFALLPYPAVKEAEAVIEQNFQNVIYISLLVLGKYVRTEVHSAHGRAGCIIETPEYVYVFEFKRDGSAKEALAQIRERGYAAPYTGDKRKIFCIGVNFSTVERNITEWEAG